MPVSYTHLGGLKLEDITDEPLKFSTSYKAGDNVGRYPLSIEAVESDKYEVEIVNGNITVDQKMLTVDDFDVTAQNKVYNASADAVLSAAVKEESKFSGDNVTAEVTGAFEDANAGDCLLYTSRCV